MASVNTQFSIAVHILSTLDVLQTMTSQKISHSLNTSPIFVRRTLSKLSKAGLIKTTRGKGGHCCLARKASDISLLEVYEAIEAPKVFAIHQYDENKKCLTSRNIKHCLGSVLMQTQSLVEKNLKGIFVSDIITSLKKNDLKNLKNKT